MAFVIVQFLVPVFIYVGLPQLLGAYRYRWVLGLACAVFMVSWWLPSPEIDGQQTSFMTHFFGGGVFAALLGLYVKLVRGWRAVWRVEAAALFMLVSSLGVLNELFEVVLYANGLMPHGIGDTSWDLVANTAGAFSFYAGYTAGQAWRSRSDSTK